MVKRTTKSVNVEKEQTNPEYEKAEAILGEKNFVRYELKGFDKVFQTTRLAQLKKDEKDYGIAKVVE